LRDSLRSANTRTLVFIGDSRCKKQKFTEFRPVPACAGRYRNTCLAIGNGMDGRCKEAFAVITGSTSSPGYGGSNRLLNCLTSEPPVSVALWLGLRWSAVPISCRASLEEIQIQMKGFLVPFSFALAISLITPCAFAQNDPANHVELGVFGEYYRFSAGGNANLLGVGARASANVLPMLQVEADVSYDFQKAFSEGFTSTSGGAVTFSNSNVKRYDGLFGFKVESPGPVKFFLLAQGGATSFAFSPASASFAGFTSTLGNLRTTNIVAEFYPGGGVEAFFGPIGLRVDVGDEMYFANTTRNNLRVTFGPSIRF